MPYLDKNVVSDYTDCGSGPVLVLIHAFATDRRLWQPQVEALSDRYRVIAPDLRGFGSAAPTNGTAISMDGYADDIRLLLDNLHLASATVVGLSLGGYIALSLALRYPGTLSGLVLANTRAGADSADGRRARFALAEEVRQRGPSAVVAAYGDKLFGPNASTEVKVFVRDLMMQQSVDGIISAILGMADRPDCLPFLADISTPTLIITGSADTLIPDVDASNMKTGIRGSALISIEGAGHLSNIDSASKFNATLREFLDGP